MARTAFDLLQRPPKIMDIMVYLLDKDEEDVGSVMSNLNLATHTFYSAIDRLRLLGFLYSRREKGWPTHKYVGLTNKGKEVAELLHPLAKIVGDTVEGLTLELRDLEGKERTEEENRRMVEILKDLQEINLTMGEWSEAEILAKRTSDIASPLGDDESLSQSLRTLGKIHFRRGDYSEAESEVTNSLGISTRINDLTGMAESHYFFGAICEQRGEYDRATEEYASAAEISESAGSEVLGARCDLGLGRMLARQGRFKDSMRRMRKSIDVFERLGEDEELARAYANAGATAFYINLDESLKWHKKSMEVANRNSDLRMLGYSLCNLAGVLNKKGEPRNALTHLEEAYKISERLDERAMMCSVNIQKGWAYRLERKWGDAGKCFEQALQVAEASDLPYELGDALLNWALMDIDRGKDREAKSKLKRALEVFGELDNQAKVNKIRNVLGRLSP